jgi:hypothetical protein
MVMLNISSNRHDESARFSPVTIQLGLQLGRKHAITTGSLDSVIGRRPALFRTWGGHSRSARGRWGGGGGATKGSLQKIAWIINGKWIGALWNGQAKGAERPPWPPELAARFRTVVSPPAAITIATTLRKIHRVEPKFGATLRLLSGFAVKPLGKLVDSGPAL